MPRKLGEILANMVLFGDIKEAVWPQEWMSKMDLPTFKDDDPEGYVRASIAATILKLTNGGEGGACSADDELVAKCLRQEV